MSKYRHIKHHLKNHARKHKFPIGGFLILVILALAALLVTRDHKEVRGVQTNVPYLEKVELAFNQGVGDYNGNGWGSHSNRIVRTSNGDVYTAVLAPDPAKPSSQDFRAWKLVKRDNATGQWTAQTPTGAYAKDDQRPPNILRGPNDEIYVISTPKMLPRVWTSTTNTEVAVPGTWYRNPRIDPDTSAEATHLATGINTNGDVYLTKYRAAGCAGAEIPGSYDLAYLNKATGQWNFRTNMMFPGDKPNTDCSVPDSSYPASHSRYEYHHIFPTANGMNMVGTLDVRSFALGCPAVAGRLDYYFNGIGVVNWSNPSAQPSAPMLLPVPNTIPAQYQLDCRNMNVRFAAADAYYDTMGRTHVLYDFQGPQTNGVYTNRHAVIQNGIVIRDHLIDIPYVNYGRIIQDAQGKFFLYSVGPGSDGKTCTMYLQKASDGDTDGTRYDPMQQMVLRDKNNATFDCQTEMNHYIAAPRGGTQLADYVDGVVAANWGIHWVYYRLQLHGGTLVEPTSAPTPTIAPPTGTQTGKINAVPASVSLNVGDTLDTFITVTSDPADKFNTARASVSVSSNLSVQNIKEPEGEYGPCAFVYTEGPTVANPSFAGTMAQGQNANSCTVYKMAVKALTPGVGTINLSNGSVKTPTNSEILSSYTNVSYEIKDESARDNSLGLFKRGSLSALTNGNIENEKKTYFNPQTVNSGSWMKFDLGTPKVITEATWYQSGTHQHGTWKWQASNDNSTWTDIGIGFVLGGVKKQIQTQLNGNSQAYRYYRLVGVGGTAQEGSWLEEIILEPGEVSTSTSPGLLSKGALGHLVNGVVDGEQLTHFADKVVGPNTWMVFDFRNARAFTEAVWHQNSAEAHGTWKWQASNDNSTWTDIGDSFTLGGRKTQIQEELNSNSTAYRYYRLLGVSGQTQGSPWLEEIEFRVGGIATTTSDNLFLVGSLGNLINGTIDGEKQTYFNDQAVVADSWMKFDFGREKVITEAKWYQSGWAPHGTWKWQASNDNSTWTDIGSAFTLGGDKSQVQTELNDNATAYRYYRLQGVSGQTKREVWLEEIEFKVKNPIVNFISNIFNLESIGNFIKELVNGN